MLNEKLLFSFFSINVFSLLEFSDVFSGCDDFVILPPKCGACHVY